MITNEELHRSFVDDATMHYFRRKLPELGERVLRARIEETLKFLFIASECHGSIPVSREIDDVWHLWILQTVEYAALCERLPTGTFIHHSSNDYLRYFDEAVGKGNPLDEDVRMLALYASNFGPLGEDRVSYWLLAAELARRGWSVAQINAWLRGADEPPPRRARRTPPPARAGMRRETPQHPRW